MSVATKLQVWVNTRNERAWLLLFEINKIIELNVRLFNLTPVIYTIENLNINYLIR